MKIGDYHSVEYLGDSVYIGLDELGRVWIFIFNGDYPKNEICLEDTTLGNLVAQIEKFGYK